jgi:hypothetical protein
VAAEDQVDLVVCERERITLVVTAYVDVQRAQAVPCDRGAS